MRFNISIKLGNDAMQSGDDVARALTILAGKLADSYDGLALPETDGVIYDANGNRVGTWEVEA